MNDGNIEFDTHAQYLEQIHSQLIYRLPNGGLVEDYNNHLRDLIPEGRKLVNGWELLFTGSQDFRYYYGDNFEFTGQVRYHTDGSMFFEIKYVYTKRHWLFWWKKIPTSSCEWISWMKFYFQLVPLTFTKDCDSRVLDVKRAK